MEAKTVYENIEFQRGRDPKESIGIGVNPKNMKSFIELVIRELPSILGTEKIPEDIIIENGAFISTIYSEKINDFLVNIMEDFEHPYGRHRDYHISTDDSLGYNFWEELHEALYKLGYEKPGS